MVFIACGAFPDMTPAEFKGVRKSLGMTQEAFARALGFGKSGRRQVARIEAGATITGPLSLAVAHLLNTMPRLTTGDPDE